MVPKSSPNWMSEMGSCTWRLDEESSYLTNVHTPFGWYRWRRLPFGINFAPEVFQRKMHELIEGLSGIEVVGDDFIVVGCGNTVEEANRDHDKNLVMFLERCKEQGVKLNTDKLTLRQNEIPFIGHVATGKGLRVDPAKVWAISEMPAPADKAGVQTVGTCTVPRQILATLVRHHQIIKRTDAERRRVGVGQCTANSN